MWWMSNPSFFTYAASDRQHSDLDTTDVWKKKHQKKKNQARQKQNNLKTSATTFRREKIRQKREK